MSLDEKPENELITIANIVRPHGLKGDVLADLLTDFPDRFKPSEDFQVRAKSGSISVLKLERSRLHQKRIVLKFFGYDDCNRAEELRNSQVIVSSEQLIQLPDNTYYEFDLRDCNVTTMDGTSIGKVSDVRYYGAAPILIVVDADREYMIPLVEKICKVIDTDLKKIVIDPPEGLLDL